MRLENNKDPIECLIKMIYSNLQKEIINISFVIKRAMLILLNKKY